VPRRSLFALAFGLLMTFCNGKAHAGSNGGGVLILHANPGLTWTDSVDFCGGSELASCDSAIVTVVGGFPKTTVFHALAGFAAEASPKLSAVTFGIDYNDEALELVARGSCADFELSTDDWPDPGSGTALFWEVPRESKVNELYWFAAYVYSAADSSLFSLSPHPAQGGTFADDSLPSQLDPVTGFGSLGFAIQGAGLCPSPEEGTGMGGMFEGGSSPAENGEPTPSSIGWVLQGEGYWWGETTAPLLYGRMVNINDGDYVRNHTTVQIAKDASHPTAA